MRSNMQGLQVKKADFSAGKKKPGFWQKPGFLASVGSIA
jgi:hypothetical protein